MKAAPIFFVAVLSLSVGCFTETPDDEGCGDGVVQPSETCDGDCPTSCDDANPCTEDTLLGSPEACDVVCSNESITVCELSESDGCCPNGCTSLSDGDCSASCGNGIVEAGETCDGNCPASCNDANACTQDTLTGGANTCDVVCENELVAACSSGDGCCPAGCTVADDSDCSAFCGNGVVDTNETCDGNCPSTCDDANACTTDTLIGSASTCSASCSFTAVWSCASGDGCCPAGCNASNDDDCSPSCGDGVIDANETCDGNCPTSCDDLNACTTDALVGSAATCTASCSATPIEVCADGDGCCPTGCNTSSDNDCSPTCGNGVVDGNETCDGNCPTSCDDGLVCTEDTLTGNVSTCSAACVSVPIVTCVSGDGCCPSGCNAGVDGDCPAVCGNGYVDTNETCDGGCPSSCDDGVACTSDTLTGSIGSCTALCVNDPISTCSGGDGCCPAGCNAGVDVDCPTVCGNGYVDTNETCDGNCPASCDDGLVCTTDTTAGSASTCNLSCTHAPVTACSNGDGCCPAACDTSNDDDCSATCTSIADLRATPDGAVSLDLCPALVTYLGQASYTLQVEPTGPAIMVFEGFSWVPDVSVGDLVTLRATALSTYHGLKEITLHDPVQIVSTGNPVAGLVQDISAGILPSEDLESELVRADNVTVTAIASLNLTISYGTATGVTLRYNGTTAYSFCVGATFDYSGISYEYDVYQLQSFNDADFSNFDTTNCPSLGRTPVAGDLVLNEFLADPHVTILGDANCDGIQHALDDEFLEIVNVSPDPLDMSGVTVYDSAALRYTFAGLSLPPGGVFVLFGGGNPSCGNWSANVQVDAATNGLGLNNTTESIYLLDDVGSVLIAFDYPAVGVPDTAADTSLTFSPDLNTAGGYVLHNSTPAGLLSSPGNRIDGTPFP